MKRGIVKCSKQLLEELLFEGKAKIDRVVETDEDVMRDQVSLVVVDHDSLPEVADGQVTPLVVAVFEKSTTAFHFEELHPTKGSF
jgi:hypothetical protein